MQDLRDAGYLPEAVLNYLALLGWGYDESTEFHSIDELQERFSLERVSKSPAVFDEQKLRHFNGRYLRELDVDDLTARLEALTGRIRAPRRGRHLAGQDQHAGRVLAARRLLLRRSGRRSGGPREGARGARRPRGARRRRGPRSSSVPEPWTEENVQAALDGVADRMGIKRKQVFQPLRVAVTGTTVSPGIFETVALLGRDETLARVDHALNGRKGT